MRIFVTGATGFLGGAIVDELIRSGHQVLGLARSSASAAALVAKGAEVHRGDLDDLASLRRGVALADGVIHTAFNHDFSRFAANCEADLRVIEAMGDALQGSDRPLVSTSVVGMGSKGAGKPATEDYVSLDFPLPRKASEIAAAKLAMQGVNVSIVRLPQVHDTEKQGLVSYLIELARQKGVSAYVGEGDTRWAAVHVSDAARLYVLALERGLAGSRYHAVAEEGLTVRSIAETLGHGLAVPVERLSPEAAPAHFGWLSTFMSHDMSASSALTQASLPWRPTGPGLIADLERMRYA